MSQLLRRFFVAVIFFITISGHTQAQNLALDSLATSVSQHADSLQGYILYDLGLEHKENDLLRAAQFFEQATELARKNGNVPLLIESLIQAGYVSAQLSEPDLAISRLIEALELSQKIRDSYNQALAHLHLSYAYLNQQNYPRSLYNLRKAAEIAEQTQDESLLYGIHLQYGDHYYSIFAQKPSATDNLDSIVFHYQEALKMAEQNQWKVRQIDALRKLSPAYSEKGEYQTSMALLQKALDYSLEDGIPADMPIDIYFQKGNIFRALGNWENAQSFYQKGLELAASRAMFKKLCHGWYQMGILYKSMEKWGLASDYFLLSAGKAKELGLKNWILNNYGQLINIYEKQQDFEKAYLMHREYTRLKDLVFNERQSQQIAEIESRHELKEKQQEITLLTQESKLKTLSLQRQKATAYWLGAIALMAVLVALVLFWLFRFKRRTNEKLTKKNQEIAQQANALADAYERLQLLSEMGRSITSKLSVEGIIHMVYEHLNHLMDAAVFGIGLPDREKGILFFPGALENGQVLDDIQFPFEEQDRLAVQCFLEQKEIFITDLEEEYWQYAPNPLPPKSSKDAQSIIYLPLGRADEKLGVVTVQSFQKNAFTEKHRSILKNLAVYIRIGLENAAAFQQIEESRQELQQANKAISMQNEKIAIQHKQQQALNQEKNLIIGIVAHDLKNPVAVAMSMADYLLSEAGYLHEDHLEALGAISRSLAKMNEMIHQILDLKRIESKQNDLEIRPMNMAPVLEELRESYGEMAGKKGIRLNFSLPPTQLAVRGEYGYLFQIFDNLLSNAVKYTYPQTNVYLEAKVVGGQVVTSIRDEGPGISLDDQKKLFEAFQRLSAKPTGGEHSTGLGLSIVKKYVEALNGRVWCESAAGQGATFHVAFEQVNGAATATS